MQDHLITYLWKLKDNAHTMTGCVGLTVDELFNKIHECFIGVHWALDLASTIAVSKQSVSTPFRDYAEDALSSNVKLGTSSAKLSDTTLLDCLSQNMHDLLAKKLLEPTDRSKVDTLLASKIRSGTADAENENETLDKWIELVDSLNEDVRLQISTFESLQCNNRPPIAAVNPYQGHPFPNQPYQNHFPDAAGPMPVYPVAAAPGTSGGWAP
ncbi:hypothetical protein AAF712_016227 [Marasmius tenuissimus]|uniref:Uncharacterized protein n=1 Tax=Marasmius tenuissimus TaxID=585030 RepID=A0ABR2Z847_9AGAR